ncbi:MAG: TolC family protein [Gemmatimonadaceae bacterium]
MSRSFTLAVALLAATPPWASAQAQRPLSLGEVVRLAADQGSPTQAARARVDQADARIRQKRSELYPSLSASAVRLGRQFNTATLGFEFSGPTGEPFFDPRGTVIGPVNTLDFRVRATQNLFDLGAWQRVRASSSSAHVSEIAVDVAAEEAAAVAASAYVRAARGDAQVLARASDSTLAAELLRIAQDQLTAGVGIALDVTRARSQLASIRAQLIAARNERDRARLELQRALSLPADSSIEISDSLAALAARDTGGDDAPPQARPPELRSLEAQRLAADEQLRATRYERLPVLSAFGDHGPIQGAGGALLPTYTFGIQLAVPIFDGFRREGRIEEQVAQRRELDVRRHDVERQVELDIRSARLDVASAREQSDAARERLAFAEQEVTQARDRFRAGVAGNAEVVTASLSLSQARTVLVDALAAQLNARVALARAHGIARELR